jgi:hypothetical protein
MDSFFRSENSSGRGLPLALAIALAVWVSCADHHHNKESSPPAPSAQVEPLAPAGQKSSYYKEGWTAEDIAEHAKACAAELTDFHPERDFEDAEATCRCSFETVARRYTPQEAMAIGRDEERTRIMKACALKYFVKK